MESISAICSHVTQDFCDNKVLSVMMEAYKQILAVQRCSQPVNATGSTLMNHNQMEVRKYTCTKVHSCWLVAQGDQRTVTWANKSSLLCA